MDQERCSFWNSCGKSRNSVCLIVILGLIAVGFSAAFGGEMGEMGEVDKMGEMDESVSEGRFIQTAIMGSDDRCPLSYGSQATTIEKAFYGVGAFYRPSSETSAETDNHYNKGTGQLVGDRDLVVTAAHNFRKAGTSDHSDWEKYRFFVRVWVPEQRRKSLAQPYEFRSFGIKRICFGAKTAIVGHHRDFAFLQLSERVSEVVDGIPVDPQHWIEPLAFDGRGRESFPNVAMTVGFHSDKKWVAQKNCKPFSLFDQAPDVSPSFLSPEKHGLLITDGDFMKRSSGSSIALLDEKGKPHLAAILAGDLADGPKVNFNGRDQFNYAVDAKEFYNEFVGFRKSSDASGDELCEGYRVIPLRSRI